MNDVRSVPTLDVLHQYLEKLANYDPTTALPRYLFRGERDVYPETYSLIDRYYHSNLDVWDEIDNVTAFAMRHPLPARRLPPKLAGAHVQAVQMYHARLRGVKDGDSN